jgi:hypothetical protein
MARNYLQGKFEPKYPEKYVGDVKNIVFRSSWERKAMIWFDNNPAVLKWASEEQWIPYISPVDHIPHKYYIDFIISVRTKTGENKVFAIEIKPQSQVDAPKTPKRQTKAYIESIKTYAVNQAKWKAAVEWCGKQNMEFKILTENELGIKR